jgi:hypothetical protein
MYLTATVLAPSASCAILAWQSKQQVLFYKPSLTLFHHLLNVLLQIANKLGLLKKKICEPIV